MISRKITVLWRSRNRREKILIAALAAILFWIGGRASLTEPLQAYRIHVQKKMVNAKRQILWLQQQETLMAPLSQAEKIPAGPLAERVRNHLPDNIAIRQWTDPADGQLTLSVEHAELYPLMLWLNDLENHQGIRVARLDFYGKKSTAEVVIQEGLQ